MSRQNKLRKKQSASLDAVFDHDEKGNRVGVRRKGAKSTTPKHGKTHRFSYSEPMRSVAMRRAGLMARDA